MHSVRWIAAVCCIAGLLLAGPATAADWYVDGKKGNDANNGTARKPFLTIGRGLTAATDGDTVHVGAWTYRENLLVSAKTVTLGGSGVAGTVIDGGAVGPVLKLTDGASVSLSGFTIRNGADDPLDYGGGGGIYCDHSTITVDHCALSGNDTRIGGTAYTGGGGAIFANYSTVTVTNSSITGNAGNGTGGLELSNSNTHLIDCDISHNTGSYCGGAQNGNGYLAVTGCTFSFNQGMDGGAVSVSFYGTVILTDNHMYSNSAANGAAVYISGYSSATLSGNVIEGNTATGVGGGIAAYNSSANADGNIIRNNVAGTEGGGVYHGGQRLAFADNLIAGNSAPVGGGVSTFIASTSFGNCTITGNTATSGAAGLNIVRINPYNPTMIFPATLTNSIVWGNLTGDTPYDLEGYIPELVTFSDVGDDAFCGLGGNICADPVFAAGDAAFHLGEASPCRDAGADPGGPTLAFDYDGDPRRFADGGDGLFDMGADEFTAPSQCPDADADGWTVCGGDCNDADAQVNPGMNENGKRRNDGKDNDCNGIIDG